ncbi:MAG: peptidylprolyl isomerase [Planctomycetaceae bacterium]
MRNLFVCSLIAVAMLSSVSYAQPGDAAAAPVDFKKLCADRDAALAKIDELRTAFQTATPDKRVAIEEEFGTVVTDLRERIFVGLEKLLPEQLEKNFEDQQVRETAAMIMQIAFQENRYQDVLKVTEKVSSLDPQDADALNLNGVARFAEHDFAGALAQFEKAAKANLLIPELGGRYQKDAKDYVEYWKTESATRERTDAIADPNLQLPQVLLKTTQGDILIELFEDEAPNTVANFISLVESKYYDGLRFHRVIPGFMAQGGCPNTRDDAQGAPGTGGPGYNIKCETGVPNARVHFSGSLSMAHAGKDTGGSQFFLTHLPTSHLNGVHTVFGRVVKGLDVARSLSMGDQITSATVVRKRNHAYQPEKISE